MPALPDDIVSIAEFRSRRTKSKEAQQTPEAIRVWRFDADKEVVEVVVDNWLFRYNLAEIEKRADWLRQCAQAIKQKRRKATHSAAWDAMAAGKTPTLTMLAEQVHLVVSRHSPGATARSLEEHGVPAKIAVAAAKSWTNGSPSAGYRQRKSAHLSTDEAQSIVASYHRELRKVGISPLGWDRK